MYLRKFPCEDQNSCQAHRELLVTSLNFPPAGKASPDARYAEANKQTENSAQCDIFNWGVPCVKTTC